MKNAYYFKHTLTFLLSIVLVLFLCACSQNVSNPNTSAVSEPVPRETSTQAANVKTPEESATVSPEASTNLSAQSSDTASVPPADSPKVSGSTSSVPPADSPKVSGSTSPQATITPPPVDTPATTPSNSPSPQVSNAPSQSPTTSNATSEPSSATSAFKAVLQGQAEFFSTDANINLNITQLNQAISPEITVDVTNFAIINIGHGGTSAVVLSLNANGNDYGVEVLSYQDGVVYGYTFSSRQFSDLRNDGTFESSGGAGDVGINTISFDKKTYSIDKFTYCESNTNSDGTISEAYFVNHKSTTEDKYNAAFDQWQKIPYVTWYDFTAANVNVKLS